MAAAADVRGAFEACISLLRAAPAGRDATFAVTYGSTGNLARQIEQGAPFAVFLAADEHHALRLVKAGLSESAGLVYAIGRLALVTPRGSAFPRLDGKAQLAAFKEAVVAGRIARFAIANPGHAPYGERARDVLERIGLWMALEKRLVLGENVAQAAQFVASGAADAGFVAASLTRLPELAARIDATIVPQDLHQPLRQRAIVLNKQPPAAHALLAFLAGAEAQRIFVEHGFEPAPAR